MTLILLVLIFLMAYHLIVYPLIIIFWSKLLLPKSVDLRPEDLSHWPDLTIIVPVYNESKYIQRKIENLAALHYPGLLQFSLVFDGCTDNSFELARKALPLGPARDSFTLKERPVNCGKLAVLNDEIGQTTSALVALSDASAILPHDALLRLVPHFTASNVGFVCGSYSIVNSGHKLGGEGVYWRYQNIIKTAESEIATLIGPHGAFYLFLKDLWEPIREDTINDDFVMPMKMVAKGFRGVYVPEVVALELEHATSHQEFTRRVRMGAGNIQQIFMLKELLYPTRGSTAFLFGSGKALRAFLPLISIAALILAPFVFSAEPMLFYVVLAFEVSILCLIIIIHSSKRITLGFGVSTLAYALQGMLASAVGSIFYLIGRSGRVWKLSSSTKEQSQS